MASVYLSLGSNLGDREQSLSLALRKLGRIGQVLKASSIYETEPVGYKDQPWFLNLACETETHLPPQELLRALKDIEKEMGRLPGPRFGPRPIDIDILFYDDLILDTPTLTIPHPRLSERGFVLIPLAEIAPQFIHPQHQKLVSRLRDSLSGKETVRRYSGSGVKDSPASSSTSR